MDNSGDYDIVRVVDCQDFPDRIFLVEILGRGFFREDDRI